MADAATPHGPIMGQAAAGARATASWAAPGRPEDHNTGSLATSAKAIAHATNATDATDADDTDYADDADDAENANDADHGHVSR